MEKLRHSGRVELIPLDVSSRITITQEQITESLTSTETKEKEESNSSSVNSSSTGSTGTYAAGAASASSDLYVPKSTVNSDVLQHALRGQGSKTSNTHSGKDGLRKGGKHTDKPRNAVGKDNPTGMKNDMKHGLNGQMRRPASHVDLTALDPPDASASTNSMAGKSTRSVHNALQQQRLYHRYHLFWDGVNGMIDIQNRTKLGAYSKHAKDNKYKDDFERLAALHLIHPSGTFKVIWDMVAGMAIFYSVLEVPFSISFSQNAARDAAAVAVDYFVIAVFFADILVTFMTSFVDSHTDRLVTDRRLIGLNYVKFWFWVDLVSSIPFDAINVTTDGNSGRSET